MHAGSITIRLPVDLREIERLNRIVRQFGDLHEVPSRSLYAVNLALDEVVTNLILHGFEDAEGAKHAEFEVRLAAEAETIHAEVEDTGRAFNPLDAPPPDLTAPLDQRSLGGLGIHLVRSLMDGVKYRREKAKNVLTMHKRIR